LDFHKFSRVTAQRSRALPSKFPHGGGLHPGILPDRLIEICGLFIDRLGFGSAMGYLERLRPIPGDFKTPPTAVAALI
jgi:hypothetical protein